MDALSLSRLQFAITPFIHSLFVPLTIGLALMIAILETVYARTGRAECQRMAKFWGGLFLSKGRVGFAWLASSVTIVAITFFGAIGMYPNMVPSTIDPGANSIVCFRAASSPLTLTIMLGVIAFLLPIILAYQFWVYRMFSHKIDPSELVY